MKMEKTSSSPSLSSSSISVKDSSHEPELPLTQQTLPAATPDATVSGNAVSPPLGSDLSLATPNSTLSGNAESPPLGSDLSLATPNSTLSVTARSPPLDHPLAPPPKSQKLEAGSSARVKSSLSLASIPAKDSSQERELPRTQQTLPEATATPPPLGKDLSLGQANTTVSGTPAFPPPGSGVSNAPSQVPTQDVKQRALKFPITTITIGGWTKASVQRQDIEAKCYFGKKQLMWEFLDDEEFGNGKTKRRKKIEMEWSWILSHKACHLTGTLDFELSRAPRFYMEADQFSVGNKWHEISELAPNHPSSTCRRHRLHVALDVLKKSYEELLKGWPQMAHQVPFPSLDSAFF